jgi:hypothetical protein
MSAGRVFNVRLEVGMFGEALLIVRGGLGMAATAEGMASQRASMLRRRRAMAQVCAGDFLGFRR